MVNVDYSDWEIISLEILEIYDKNLLVMLIY